MRLSRRKAFEALGAVVLAMNGRLLPGTPIGLASPPRLRDAAAARGLRYGTEPSTNLTKAPPAYADLVVEQCDLLAPVLPWSTSRTPGRYDFGPLEDNVSFARAHGMKLTGSHLLWHAWVPAWFNAIAERANAEKAIVGHVTAMTRRFAGEVYSWNVVNEVINVQDGRPDGLRANPFLAKLGPAYIDLAFRVAREGDPAALLLCNEYDLEAALPEHEARRRAMLDLLDGLKRKNTPIDGVGMQSHLLLGDPLSEVRLSSFLRELADRDLKIVITELDILETAGRDEARVRDQAVADLYSRFLAVALDCRAVTAVVNWGISDRYTWLSSRPGSPRPLPFDADFRPKPAFYALLRAFQNAPVR